MEYLEGETLAERLTRGPLPLEQALKTGVETAEALDKAHRAGIVHRDLKPGNIMLTKAGAKLMDFGLAKHASAAPGAGSAGRPPTPNAPTISLAALTSPASPLTQKGTIVGTFQYMAPEQLEGRDADARTDIFAFGATLNEMLTGQRAFQGASHASLITAIMSADPAPASSIQPLVTPALERLVRRCLAKDPDDRWQSARDLRQELVWVKEGGSQAGAPAVAGAGRKPQSRIAWAAAGLFAAAMMVLAALLLRQEKPVPRPLRFTINAPEGNGLYLVGRPAVSSDGENILFGVGGGQLQMYLHSLATGATRAVPGTEGAAAAYWSFDAAPSWCSRRVLWCGWTSAAASSSRCNCRFRPHTPPGDRKALSRRAAEFCSGSSPTEAERGSYALPDPRSQAGSHILRCYRAAGVCCTTHG